MRKYNKILYHICSVILGLASFVYFRRSKPLNNNCICYLTFLDIKYDGRVRKSVDALLQKGYKVELVYPRDAAPEPIESWHPNLVLVQCGLSGSYTHFPYIYDWEVLDYLKSSDAYLIYCRDLFSGLMATIIGGHTKQKVIVDFFEWYSAAKDYDYIHFKTSHKPFWKKELFKFYERYICKNAYHLISNNKSFAEGIAQGVVPLNKFTLIRNMPDQCTLKIDAQYDLKQFIPQEHKSKKMLYYIGQLSFDRKLDTLIRSMDDLPECVLIIQGPGHIDVQFFLKKELNETSAKDRIFFLPPIPDHEIIHFASSADVGVFICDTNDAKMRYALPNKLFEYVMAEIPQVCCDGYEISKVIHTHNIGLIFDAYDPTTFVVCVNKIIEHETYVQIHKNIKVCKRYLENDFSNFC